MSTASGAIDIETADELIVIEFHWPGNRVSAGLWINDQLDDFFERVRQRPSKVVVLVASPEVVDAANLELCDGWRAGSASTSWCRGWSAVKTCYVATTAADRVVSGGLRGH